MDDGLREKPRAYVTSAKKAVGKDIASLYESICSKGCGNKSKRKGDESADSVEQAESKFGRVCTALSTPILHIPSWFYRQKVLRWGEGPEKMLPEDGQSTKKGKEIASIDLIILVILEIFIKIIDITTTSFIYSLMYLSRKHL